MLQRSIQKIKTLLDTDSTTRIARHTSLTRQSLDKYKRKSQLYNMTLRTANELLRYIDEGEKIMKTTIDQVTVNHVPVNEYLHITVVQFHGDLNEKLNKDSLEQIKAIYTLDRLTYPYVIISNQKEYRDASDIYIAPLGHIHNVSSLLDAIDDALDMMDYDSIDKESYE